MEVTAFVKQLIKSPFCDTTDFSTVFIWRQKPTNREGITFTDLVVHKQLHCESCSDANAVQQTQMANQCPPYTDSGKHDRRYKSRWGALNGCSLIDAGNKYGSGYFLSSFQSLCLLHIHMHIHSWIFSAVTFTPRLRKCNSTI